MDNYDQENHVSPFASVIIHEYRNLISGRFFFIVALRMMSTLVGWWMYQLTNAPFAIGVVGLSEVYYLHFHLHCMRDM